MKRTYSYILLLLFVVTGIACSASQREEIKVLSFNIRYDNPDDAPNDWESRKPYLIDFIQSQSPDIVGLQEVLHHQLVAIESELVGYERYGVGREDGVEKGEYCPVLYKQDRFDSISHGYLWLSETPKIPSKGWDAACERMAVWVILKDLRTQKELIFINTHFDHQGEVARRESAKQVIQLADSIADGRPIILLGDFNGTVDSVPIQILLETDNPFAFKDARAHTQNTHGEPWTFHGFGEVPLADRPLIDFVLYRGAIVPISHQIYHEPEEEGHLFLSDHTPVISHFIFD